MNFNRHILPFYMTYPNVETGLPYNYQEEDTVMRDLEYLQQMYPEEVKRYQSRISQILDKLDYEGSMIYDEYPDKYQIYNLADNILTILKREALEASMQKEMDTSKEMYDENPVNLLSERKDDYDSISPEKWEWLADMIQVLLF
ncbi:MAG: hypothetical protein IJO65_02705 [Lachnospiraceae bacterium]|nr:hypothetical protein [Lachnospiraceae bacterium]